ncbi:MAG: hypothetical protein ACLR3C_18900 [Eggerthella lenta]
MNELSTFVLENDASVRVSPVGAGCRASCAAASSACGQATLRCGVVGLRCCSR